MYHITQPANVSNVPFDQIIHNSFKPPPASTNTQEELILLQTQRTKLVRPATQLEPNYFPPKLLGGDTGAEGVGMLPFLLCRQGR